MAASRDARAALAGQEVGDVPRRGVDHEGALALSDAEQALLAKEVQGAAHRVERGVVVGLQVGQPGLVPREEPLQQPERGILRRRLSVARQADRRHVQGSASPSVPQQVLAVIAFESFCRRPALAVRPPRGGGSGCVVFIRQRGHNQCVYLGHRTSPDNTRRSQATEAGNNARSSVPARITLR
jgi:hypothetical protein